MNRTELIDALASTLWPPVCAGLPTEMLIALYESRSPSSTQIEAMIPAAEEWYRRDIPNYAPTEKELRGMAHTLALSAAYNLPGETEPHSVYRIDFSTGAAYVGMTGKPIIERLCQHFGDPTNDRSIPWGHSVITAHAESGATYSFLCLASGLSKLEARKIERDHIAALEKPLNTFQQSAAHGAVAQYYAQQ